MNLASTWVCVRLSNKLVLSYPLLAYNGRRKYSAHNKYSAANLFRR